MHPTEPLDAAKCRSIAKATKCTKVHTDVLLKSNRTPQNPVLADAVREYRSQASTDANSNKPMIVVVPVTDETSQAWVCPAATVSLLREQGLQYVGSDNYEYLMKFACKDVEQQQELLGGSFWVGSCRAVFTTVEDANIMFGVDVRTVRSDGAVTVQRLGRV
jgi:hypothetical protein